MKLKSFTWFVLTLLLGIFFATGYSSSPPATTNTKKPVKYIMLEEGGFKWTVVLPKKNYLPDTPHGAVIKIQNEMDRNIVVDFDGPLHYTFLIEYKKEREVTIKAGSYKLRAATPGIKPVFKDYKYNFWDRFVYSQVWKLEILETKY